MRRTRLWQGKNGILMCRDDGKAKKRRGGMGKGMGMGMGTGTGMGMEKGREMGFGDEDRNGDGNRDGIFTSQGGQTVSAQGRLPRRSAGSVCGQGGRGTDRSPGMWVTPRTAPAPLCAAGGMENQPGHSYGESQMAPPERQCREEMDLSGTAVSHPGRAGQEEEYGDGSDG